MYLSSKILSILTLILLLCSCSNDNEQVLYFVGDSMIANWDVEAAFPNRITRNLGVDGCHIEEFSTIRISSKFDDVLVLIGTNDLYGNMSDEDITIYCNHYESHICQISNGRILVVSILPTSDKKKNNVIHRFNMEMKQRLKLHTNVVFIDCYNVFVDTDGLIKEDLTREGIHLNDYGYILLTDKVKNFL